jgi:quercetin dioxygenase-like cupin family protein
MMSEENNAEARGKVIRIQDLVDYQEGSVVSRQIIKKDAGNVTIFAFDKDEGLSEHTAPFDAIVQVCEGEAEVIISGNSHSVKKDEMIIMPANEPHALRANERFKMILIMVRSA